MSSRVLESLTDKNLECINFCKGNDNFPKFEKNMNSFFQNHIFFPSSTKNTHFLFDFNIFLISL
jgi:hypothetical protein